MSFTIKSFCFTGKGPLKRAELQKMAEETGAIVKNSVTSSLGCLVAPEFDVRSSKYKKARSLRILTISYEDFLLYVERNKK